LELEDHRHRRDRGDLRLRARSGEFAGKPPRRWHHHGPARRIRSSHASRPSEDIPNEEGGFYPLGALPLVTVLLLVDAIAAIAGRGPLLEWSPGIAELPLAGALGVAEYRRLSTWRHRHDTSTE